ncbi:hypothetical protein [Litchfieldia alkalitelluris]|uniref:hypothetical protein n=1 Tax=Litchfieldia alkalitelluris TaxID=304268 RepID=UPI0009981A29|nr:hypothetical protein [Litchfieldia alkalitelluris]
MSFFQQFIQKIFKNTSQVNSRQVKRPTIYVDKMPLRARTEEEKELEERVWQAQKEYRSRVLKERFAAQREWMAKFEREEAERIARKKAAQ